MKKPRQFKSMDVMGIPHQFTWTREEMREDSKTDMGETREESRTINVNSEQHLSSTGIEGTVLHEIMHAVLDVSGHSSALDDKTEESLVLALENGLHPIICKLVSLGYFRSPRTPRR